MSSMSLAFIFAACVFALVVGCAVACVDRWREARLKPLPRRRASLAPPSAPAPHRRAA